jgi:hypothetical protein
VVERRMPRQGEAGPTICGLASDGGYGLSATLGRFGACEAVGRLLHKGSRPVGGMAGEPILALDHAGLTQWGAVMPGRTR